MTLLLSNPLLRPPDSPRRWRRSPCAWSGGTTATRSSSRSRRSGTSRTRSTTSGCSGTPAGAWWRVCVGGGCVWVAGGCVDGWAGVPTLEARPVSVTRVRSGSAVCPSWGPSWGRTTRPTRAPPPTSAGARTDFPCPFSSPHNHIVIDVGSTRPTCPPAPARAPRFHVVEDADAIGGGVPFEFTPTVDGAAPLADAVEPLTRALAVRNGGGTMRLFGWWGGARPAAIAGASVNPGRCWCPPPPPCAAGGVRKGRGQGRPGHHVERRGAALDRPHHSRPPAPARSPILPPRWSDRCANPLPPGPPTSQGW